MVSCMFCAGIVSSLLMGLFEWIGDVGMELTSRRFVRVDITRDSWEGTRKEK